MAVTPSTPASDSGARQRAERERKKRKNAAQQAARRTRHRQYLESLESNVRSLQQQVEEMTRLYNLERDKHAVLQQRQNNLQSVIKSLYSQLYNPSAYNLSAPSPIHTPSTTSESDLSAPLPYAMDAPCVPSQRTWRESSHKSHPRYMSQIPDGMYANDQARLAKIGRPIAKFSFGKST